MGSEAEEEASSTPRLPLLAKPLSHGHIQSPERSGMLTPPLYTTAASVPFRWEEEPGKPRHSTALSKFDFPNKCLELPPRLLLLADANLTKLPSPTTVLDGPYYTGKSRFRSSSFRIIRRERHVGSSFRWNSSPQRDHQLGAMVLSKRGLKDRLLFGWGRRKKASKGKKEVSGSSHVFPSSGDRSDADDDSSCNENNEDGSSKKANMASFRRTGSFSTLSPARSQFWVSIYKGLKNVVPWRTRKFKEDGLAI